RSTRTAASSRSPSGDSSACRSASRSTSASSRLVGRSASSSAAQVSHSARCDSHSATSAGSSTPRAYAATSQCLVPCLVISRSLLAAAARPAGRAGRSTPGTWLYQGQAEGFGGLGYGPAPEERLHQNLTVGMTEATQRIGDRHGMEHLLSRVWNRETLQFLVVRLGGPGAVAAMVVDRDPARHCDQPR